MKKLCYKRTDGRTDRAGFIELWFSICRFPDSSQNSGLKSILFFRKNMPKTWQFFPPKKIRNTNVPQTHHRSALRLRCIDNYIETKESKDRCNRESAWLTLSKRIFCIENVLVLHCEMFICTLGSSEISRLFQAIR